MPEGAVTNLICEERMNNLREEVRICLHDQEERTKQDIVEIKGYIKWGIGALFGLLFELSLALVVLTLTHALG